MSETPKWSPYVVLGGTAFGAVLEGAGLVIFGHLLAKYVQNRFKLRSVIEICPSMVLYMIAEILNCFAVGIYLSYVAVFWQYDSSHYNAYLLFVLGALQSTLNTAKPVTVFSLGLDRVCCILFPFTFVEHRRFYPILASCVPIAIIFYISFSSRIIPNWPTDSLTACATYGCMTSIASGEIYTVQRFIVSGANMFIGACLIVLIAKKLQNTSHVRAHSNRLVLTTLCLTFLLDLMPHIISTFGFQILKVNPAIYIGPYSSILGALESFSCSIVYRRAFNRVRKTNGILRVVHSNSRTVHIRSTS